MKNILKTILYLVFFWGAFQGFAQEKPKLMTNTEKLTADSVAVFGKEGKGLWDKKYRFALTANISFTTFRGSALPQDYFIKPSLGGGLLFEYMHKPFIGFGTGLVLQQRGTGVINTVMPSNLNQSGDPSHRERLKTLSMEIPLYLIVRTPQDLIKGVRPSGTLGFIFAQSLESHDIFYSVEDGIHNESYPTNQYWKRDLILSLSLGADVCVSENSLFRVHIVGNFGAANVFTSQYLTAGAKGRNQLLGMGITWIY